MRLRYILLYSLVLPESMNTSLHCWMWISYQVVCFIDINECRTLSGLCQYGRCRNKEGRSSVSPLMSTYMISCCCYFFMHLSGGFTCDCQEGYTLTSDGRDCRDINECNEVAGMCSGGECINSDGYHQCICPKGFKISKGGTSCVGMLISTFIALN